MQVLELYKVSRKTRISWDRCTSTLCFWVKDLPPPGELPPICNHTDDTFADFYKDPRDRDAIKFVLSFIPEVYHVWGLARPLNAQGEICIDQDETVVQDPVAVPLAISSVDVTQDGDDYEHGYQFKITYSSSSEALFCYIDFDQHVFTRRITQSLRRECPEDPVLTLEQSTVASETWANAIAAGSVTQDVPDSEYAIGVTHDDVEGTTVVDNKTEMTLTAWYRADQILGCIGTELQHTIGTHKPFVIKEKFLCYDPGEVLFVSIQMPRMPARLTQEEGEGIEVEAYPWKLLPVSFKFYIAKNPGIIGGPSEETDPDPPTLTRFTYDDGLPYSAIPVEAWHDVDYRYLTKVSGGDRIYSPQYRRIHYVYPKRSAAELQLPCITTTTPP